MTKSIFRIILSLVLVLFITSCSKEELSNIGLGEKAQVVFSIGIDKDHAKRARAISDGTGANRLVYALFDANGARITEFEQVDKTVTFPAKEQINLAKGQTYKIAFWAQNSNCTAYTINNNMVVTVDHTGVNNDEGRDAFFGSTEFTVTDDNMAVAVTLKRPFAQLNVGVTTADWDGAVASGLSVTQSEVTVSNVANSINLLDGSVAGTSTLTYTFADIPTETISTDADGDGTAESYKYLSMSYLLPDAVNKTTLSTVSFKFKTASGTTLNFSNGLSNVPVQRNWRTNIVGRILTGAVDFTITIDPGFEGDNGVDIWDGVTTKEPASTATEYLISDASEWAWLKGKNLGGRNLKLVNNIDFAGHDIKGLGFTGEFDGQGYEMVNMTILPGGSNYSNGLFQGDASGVITVKNVTFRNVTVDSNNPDNGYAGVVIGDAQNSATLINVHVIDADVKGVQSVAGLVGFVASGRTLTLEGCSVSDSYIHNYAVENESGFVAGLAGRPVGTVVVTDCSVKDTKIDGFWATRRGEASIASGVGNQGDAGATIENVIVNKTQID